MAQGDNGGTSADDVVIDRAEINLSAIVACIGNESPALPVGKSCCIASSIESLIVPPRVLEGTTGSVHGESGVSSESGGGSVGWGTIEGADHEKAKIDEIGIRDSGNAASNTGGSTEADSIAEDVTRLIREFGGVDEELIKEGIDRSPFGGTANAIHAVDIVNETPRRGGKTALERERGSVWLIPFEKNAFHESERVSRQSRKGAGVKGFRSDAVGDGQDVLSGDSAGEPSRVFLFFAGGSIRKLGDEDRGIGFGCSRAHGKPPQQSSHWLGECGRTLVLAFQFSLHLAAALPSGAGGRSSARGAHRGAPRVSYGPLSARRGPEGSQIAAEESGFSAGLKPFLRVRDGVQASCHVAIGVARRGFAGSQREGTKLGHLGRRQA
jgi:hypothetical protein